MEYKIASVSGAWSLKSRMEKLEKAVAELIALGWEPLGGIAITDYSASQAMIKRR